MKKIATYLRIVSLAYRAEFRTVMHNKGALLILIGAVIIYPIIYSISYSPELVRELPIALVNQDETASSRLLAQMIDATEQIELSYRVNTLEEAKQLFENNIVKGIILIPKDFESKLYKGQQSTLSTYCDASYMLIYKQTLTGVVQSSLTFAAGVEVKRHMSKGSSREQAIEQAQAIKIKFNDLYNPSSSYGSYVMPALIIFILQQTLFIGIGLIGGYQREHGRHIHTIRGFDRHTTAIIWGKTLTYLSITIFNAVFALGWVHHWFQFPTSNNGWTLLLFLIPFVLSAIFLGISISAMFKKAEQSIMVLVFLSLILMFLTGFSWPVKLFPEPLKYIRLLFPSSIIVEPYLRIREMGASLSDVKTEYIMICSQMVIYYSLTILIFKTKRSKAKKQTRLEKMEK